MSRAFITGVSGFAGRHLARRLLAGGWEVSGITRDAPCDVPGVIEHRLEIDDGAAVAAAMGSARPDVVYHLAAVVDTVTTPDVLELHRTNILGTAAVLEAAAAVGATRVLVASSAFAYGRTSAELQPVPEDAPLVPLTPYGSSKVAAEVLALQWSRATGIDVIVTRSFQHTGPGHVGAYALPEWAGQLASGTGEIRVGNLEVVRDYLDVRDTVAAYQALVEEAPAGVYNVGSGVPRSMRELLDGLIAAFGSDARVVVDPSRFRPVDQPVFVADVTRLRTATAWAPQLSIEETLRDLAAFYRHGR